jgi:hypothetical protein
MPSLPPAIIAVFLPFTSIFSKTKTWNKGILLLTGALLCHGGRTVCGALRILGMKGEKRFDKYHRVLSRDKWDPLKGAKILLGMLVGDYNDPVVIAIDEHIERRKGSKIKAKGCYRDAVRSSKGLIVKCFGLKWITVMVLKKFPWASRTFALPFLTVLAPSSKANKQAGKEHKTTIAWAIQIMMQIKRWLPKRKIIFTGDGGFANAALSWECLKHNVSLVTRLRLDARLFDFPELKLGPGRPAKKGSRLSLPKEMFKLPNLQWNKVDVRWYKGGVKQVEYITFTCLWHVVGYEPVPIRVVLLKDPEGKYESVPLMSTDVHLTVIEIVEAFVSRWNQEVTHREVRDYLGVETQRQWSDLAIARTTPVLFSLYSFVILIADALNKLNPLKAQKTAWYQKESLTFSDALKEVKQYLWRSQYFKCSEREGEPLEILSEGDAASLIELLSEVI